MIYTTIVVGPSPMRDVYKKYYDKTGGQFEIRHFNFFFFLVLFISRARGFNYTSKYFEIQIPIGLCFVFFQIFLLYQAYIEQYFLKYLLISVYKNQISDGQFISYRYFKFKRAQWIGARKFDIMSTTTPRHIKTLKII